MSRKKEATAKQTTRQLIGIDEITDSRGVVFATGTPVSNSMTELYNADKRIRKELEKSIQSVTLKLRAVSQKRTRLYEDFADGILSDEEYAYAKTSFDERWETLNHVRREQVD